LVSGKYFRSRDAANLAAVTGRALTQRIDSASNKKAAAIRLLPHKTRKNTNSNKTVSGPEDIKPSRYLQEISS